MCTKQTYSYCVLLRSWQRLSSPTSLVTPTHCKCVNNMPSTAAAKLLQRNLCDHELLNLSGTKMNAIVRHYGRRKSESKTTWNADDAVDEDEMPIRKKGQKIFNVEEIASKADRDMNEINGLLVEELNSHFSLRADLKRYSNIRVKLENGELQPLSRLGQISVKDNFIMINFSDNPTAVKPAKMAIESNIANINLRQEGFLLSVLIPKPTREHRQNLIQRADSVIFNNYKKALNQVYCKYEDQMQMSGVKKGDEHHRTRATILSLKKKYELLGIEQLKEKKNEILKEVA